MPGIVRNSHTSLRHEPEEAVRRAIRLDDVLGVRLRRVAIPSRRADDLFAALKGDSYRLKNRDLGRVPGTTTEEA